MKLPNKNTEIENFIIGIGKKISKFLKEANVFSISGERADISKIKEPLKRYLEGCGIDVENDFLVDKQGKGKEFFGSKNRPDFIVVKRTPEKEYRIAIEYKKCRDSKKPKTESAAATKMKDLIGQGLFHIHSCNYHYVLCFMRDFTKGQKIKRAITEKKERAFIKFLAEQSIIVKVEGGTYEYEINVFGKTLQNSILSVKKKLLEMDSDKVLRVRAATEYRDKIPAAIQEEGIFLGSVTDNDSAPGLAPKPHVFIFFRSK